MPITCEHLKIRIKRAYVLTAHPVQYTIEIAPTEDVLNLFNLNGNYLRRISNNKINNNYRHLLLVSVAMRRAHTEPGSVPTKHTHMKLNTK